MRLTNDIRYRIKNYMSDVNNYKLLPYKQTQQHIVCRELNAPAAKLFFSCPAEWWPLSNYTVALVDKDGKTDRALILDQKTYWPNSTTFCSKLKINYMEYKALVGEYPPKPNTTDWYTVLTAFNTIESALSTYPELMPAFRHIFGDIFINTQEGWTV